MDDILTAFIAESSENLEKLDNDLVALEKEPDGAGIKIHLGRIFRTVHTIKGSCGWLGLSKLESVAHEGEELLVCLREELLPVTTEVITCLLEMFDAIRAILHHLATTGKEGPQNYEPIQLKLRQLANGSFATVTSQTQETLAEVHAETLPSPGQTLLNLPAQNLLNTFTHNETQVNLPAAIEASRPSNGDGHKASKSNDSAGQGDAFTLYASANSEITETLNQISNGNIRVDVKLLDKLMNLVGELVLARNQMLQFTHRLEDTSFLATCQRLNLITTELQEGVMKTRMQTIGTIWNKFPRVIRDLSLECGKEISLEMEGEGTELDRTIVEAIKDPLTHIVRNAVDHGIEPPDERVRLGKPPQGKLVLQAYHEGGHVNICISDDGRGLNPDRIREKAVQKGLISSTEAAQMNERSLLNLVFSPGFSTAEKVTNISGRGVGMDVVKSNIEKIGGLIDLSSVPGEGTILKIKIPLTLAIIPALLVSSHGERYAIPQVSLLELVCLEGEQAREGIEMIYQTPVYRLRGNLLPLVFLNQVLGFDSKASHLSTETEDADQMLSIVVLQADDQPFGLVVDSINDTEEIVVKPLSKQLKSLSVYTGATILGDGKVALILDVMGFAQKARVISEMQKQKLKAAAEVKQDKRKKSQSLLMFQTSGSKMVIPLALVARLEEFEAEQIEYSGGLKVIQYRQHILPLIFLAEVLPRLRGASQNEVVTESLQVIVYTEKGQSVGIVVDRILDILEADESLEIELGAKREGLLGSIVLQGAVTDLLDLRQIVQKEIPNFFQESQRSQELVGVN